MCNLSNFLLFTLSLKLLPMGPDMLRMGLIFPIFTITPKGLAWNPATGVQSKGPATNPFLTHVAIVSVSSCPWVKVLCAFTPFTGGSSLYWKASAPFLRSLTTFLALLSSQAVIFSLALFISSSKTSVNTSVSSLWQIFSRKAVPKLLPRQNFVIFKLWDLWILKTCPLCCTRTWLRSPQVLIQPVTSCFPPWKSHIRLASLDH